MIIDYYIIDPTNNITALAETPVPEELQPAVASAIMAENPEVEQVGFVRRGSLRMAGGEFCGNAAMSAAVLLYGGSLESGEKISAELDVSGADGKVNVDVLKNDDGSFTGTVTMPAPDFMENKTFELDGERFTLPAIGFKGLIHLVTEKVMDRKKAERAVRKWCADCGADGIGLMYIHLLNRRLEPLVYVRSPETLCWESTCASGTAAVGAYLYSRENNKDIEFTFSEPGGKLNVRVTDGRIFVTGTVRIVKKCRIDFCDK